MMDAATNPAAAVSGAFDVNIVIQRLPSFRKIRATGPSLPIECQFHYERGNTFDRDMFLAFFYKSNGTGVPNLGEIIKHQFYLPATLNSALANCSTWNTGA
jgi:hypothetical protein